MLCTVLLVEQGATVYILYIKYMYIYIHMHTHIHPLFFFAESALRGPSAWAVHPATYSAPCEDSRLYCFTLLYSTWNLKFVSFHNSKLEFLGSGRALMWVFTSARNGPSLVHDSADFSSCRGPSAIDPTGQLTGLAWCWGAKSSRNSIGISACRMGEPVQRWAAAKYAWVDWIFGFLQSDL